MHTTRSSIVVVGVLLASSVGTVSFSSATAAGAVIADSSRFVPVAPCVLSTNDDLAIAAGSTLAVPVREQCGIPVEASSVALTVTVRAAAANGFLSIGPTPDPVSATSAINFLTGQTRTNGLIARIGEDGAIAVRASASTRAELDVWGYFVPATTATAGRLVPLPASVRVLDTRSGAALGAGGTRHVDLPLSIPSDAIAVALTFTAQSTASGVSIAALHANGAAQPAVIGVATDGPGQVRAAGSIVPVSPGGLELASSAGGHYIIDVTGYFTGASSVESTEGLFVPVSPTRLKDTRGIDVIPQHDSIVLSSPLLAGAAAALNLTMVRASGPGFISAYPAGAARPATSVANATFAGETAASFSIVATSQYGASVYAKNGTHLVADLYGWFTGNPATVPGPPPPPDSKPPQFVMASFDGGGNNVSVDSWNAVGVRVGARMTFFLSAVNLIDYTHRMLYDPPRRPAGSSSNGFAIVPPGMTPGQKIRATVEALQRARLNGFEVGTHFGGHFCGATGINVWTSDDWRVEFQQVKSLMSNVDSNMGLIPATGGLGNFPLIGGRTPCLEGKPSAYLPVYAENGLRYDASGVRLLSDWPALRNGIWRFGVPGVTPPGSSTGLLLADYNFYVRYRNTSSAAAEQIIYATLTSSFNKVYQGTRAPLDLAGHSQNLLGGAWNRALARFLGDVCGKQSVRCVSYSEVAEWLSTHPGRFVPGSSTTQVNSGERPDAPGAESLAGGQLSTSAVGAAFMSHRVRRRRRVA